MNAEGERPNRDHVEASHTPGAGGGVTRSFKAFAALGVLGAALLAVNANVLVARWYKRWDLTHERLYTLSPATVSILSSPSKSSCS